MRIKLICIRVYSDKPIPPEIVLDVHQELPCMESEVDHAKAAAHVLLSDIILPDNIQLNSATKQEILATQTGILPDDLVLISQTETERVYAVVGKLNRLPYKYLDIFSSYEWCSAADYDNRNIKDTLLKIKDIDDKVKRTINAAEAVVKFYEEFGDADNPLKNPKKADKRVVLWVGDELKSGRLDKTALNAAVSFIEPIKNIYINEDRNYYLYRKIWPFIVAKA